MANTSWRTQLGHWGWWHTGWSWCRRSLNNPSRNPRCQDTSQTGWVGRCGQSIRRLDNQLPMISESRSEWSWTWPMHQTGQHQWQTNQAVIHDHAGGVLLLSYLNWVDHQFNNVSIAITYMPSTDIVLHFITFIELHRNWLHCIALFCFAFH